MVQKPLFDDLPDGGQVVYSMTIRLKSGKVIRRANGKPFRFVVRSKQSN